MEQTAKGIVISALTYFFILTKLLPINFHSLFLTAVNKKQKKMAFQRRPFIKISSKNKSVYTLSATGYHFTGPIALRH